MKRARDLRRMALATVGPSGLFSTQVRGCSSLGLDSGGVDGRNKPSLHRVAEARCLSSQENKQCATDVRLLSPIWVFRCPNIEKYLERIRMPPLPITHTGSRQRVCCILASMSVDYDARYGTLCLV